MRNPVKINGQWYEQPEESMTKEKMSEIERIIKNNVNYENLTERELALIKTLEQYVIKARIEELENVHIKPKETIRISNEVINRIAELKKELTSMQVEKDEG